MKNWILTFDDDDDWDSDGGSEPEDAPDENDGDW